MTFLITLSLNLHGNFGETVRTTYVDESDFDLNTEKGIEDYRLYIANKNDTTEDNVSIVFIKELRL